VYIASSFLSNAVADAFMRMMYAQAVANTLWKQVLKTRGEPPLVEVLKGIWSTRSTCVNLRHGTSSYLLPGEDDVLLSVEMGHQTWC